MYFIDQEIEAYSEAHTSPESDLLKRLNRQTHVKILHPRMLSGHFQGRMLSMISWMVRPKVVLEIGTYTGYSALCFAEGLAEGGKVITMDIKAELEPFVREFLDQSDYKNQIDYRLGNARDLIPDLDEVFDIVFIDADKPSYSTYYDLTIDRVRPGGWIIADNVLWSGKVAQANVKIDKDTQHLLDFNAKIQKDDRVENILLPIRDGLMVVRKK
ncbi:class I SAM-dependent methyltransferase [Siphonobacter sp. SORGH_AS_0500]|uniref:O-methyltransferase n=1 Tax=Siphonobacter sp. SORGH_AS_0500 TaxID=1864824 RepID=UPI0028647093|nr:class I SAM-dependent methyltransferase [Siphonobacter sp. SORGH_AS_0500]MDR6195886.1 caffeoyl-CoA O-methyltransferase [Siphonobacter sp. SORGH_AS_0500]